MNKRNKYKIDEFIEEYGEDELNSYIDLNACLEDEELESDIMSCDDLYKLTIEQFNLFKKEYKAYLDNISLDEDEEDGWRDIIEHWNNN